MVVARHAVSPPYRGRVEDRPGERLQRGRRADRDPQGDALTLLRIQLGAGRGAGHDDADDHDDPAGQRDPVAVQHQPQQRRRAGQAATWLCRRNSSSKVAGWQVGVRTPAAVSMASTACRCSPSA